MVLALHIILDVIILYVLSWNRMGKLLVLLFVAGLGTKSRANVRFFEDTLFCTCNYLMKV